MLSSLENSKIGPGEKGKTMSPPITSISHKEKKSHRWVNAEHFDGKAKDRHLPRKIRRYYHYQASLLRKYEEDRKHLLDMPSALEMQRSGEAVETCDKEGWLQNVSFLCNILLLGGKIAAAIFSSSLSIFSSVIDSLVDNTSNIVVWITSRAIRSRDPYHYPRGRTRLEPLSLMIISVIMGVASVQVIVRTVEAIITGAVNPQFEIEENVTQVGDNGTNVTFTIEKRLDWRPLGVMIATILIKSTLCVTCYVLGRQSPTIMVLAQDHRNDSMSNSMAIACGILGSKYWVHIDSIGAILISAYIAVTWVRTGYKQTSILSGRSAPSYFISRIVKICLDHHHEIRHVDSLAVYHFGTEFIVEVDIVLDQNMTVRRAHDISGELQQKLEHLPDVERAFVHVDHQTKHVPYVEHKSV